MTSPTVMERLRTETRDLHDRAEGREFQRRLVHGETGRDDYARWLGQMYLVHHALEVPLRRIAESDPSFRAVRDEQFQEPYLLADLAALGVDPATVEPLPATRSIVDELGRVAAEDPLQLLGHHYVLEGSNNGNRFIVRVIAPALGLDRDSGARYLDPYGDQQPAKWRQFKQDMNEVGFTPEQIDRLVAAARRMFEAVGDISDGLVHVRT